MLATGAGLGLRAGGIVGTHGLDQGEEMVGGIFQATIRCKLLRGGRVDRKNFCYPRVRMGLKVINSNFTGETKMGDSSLRYRIGTALLTLVFVSRGVAAGGKPAAPATTVVEQLGWSKANIAGKAPGEIGGTVR